MANAGWFVRVEKDGHETVYGPFETERRAMIMNIFQRSESELSAYQKSRGRIETYAAVGVSLYSAEELKEIAEDPGSCRLKSFKVQPASELKIHADWKNSDREFLTNYWLGEE